MLRTLLTIATVALWATTSFGAIIQSPTVYVVRVAVTASSANLGGANVPNGVNIVPYQFQLGSWVAGTPLTASPTGTGALTLSPTATSEGALSISPNHQYLGLGGYRTGTNGSGTDRVVARVDLTTGTFNGPAPAIDTTTSFTNTEGYTGNNIRAATWDNTGNQYWTAGTATSTGGIRSNTFGTVSGSTQVGVTPSNIRTINIFNGQLYSGSSTGTFVGVNTVGSGLPTASGATSTSLVAQSGSSSYGFSVSPDSLTVYIADDRATAAGGIQKWTRPDLVSAFTLATTFGTGVTNIGARGLSVDYTGVNPVIYATSAEASNDRLFTFTDVLGVQTGLTNIATLSGGVDIFRGVAVVPVPEPTLLLGAGLLGLAVLRRRR